MIVLRVIDVEGFDGVEGYRVVFMVIDVASYGWMMSGDVQWIDWPQHICPMGDHSVDHGPEVQRRCHGYRTVLIPMVAMMVQGPKADAAIQQRWFQRLEARGVVDPRHNDAGVIQYLGQAARGTARKRSQLTEAFIWLRRAYQGREQR